MVLILRCDLGNAIRIGFVNNLSKVTGDWSIQRDNRVDLGSAIDYRKQKMPP